MIIRIEIKVDGKVMQVIEQDVGEETFKAWNLLRTAQAEFRKLSALDFFKFGRKE